MDHFQEYKKQQEINEGVFGKLGKLFSKSKEENHEFYKNSDGTYGFGRNSTAKLIRPSDVYLDDFPWKGSTLEFVVSPETEFHAKNIMFDLDKEEIVFFEGIWKSGPFKGKEFYSGEFHGSSFYGGFFGPYTAYKSTPDTFVGGTFQDTTNKGILGLPNTVSIDKTKPFNIITIPPGHMLQFRSANGKDSYIKVLKRLDKNGTLFQFEVLDGINNVTQPVIKNVDWTQIRHNWNSGIYEIKSIGSKNIAGLIQVPNNDSIVEMYISTAPSTFRTSAAITQTGKTQITQAFAPDKKYSFNLSKIPNLNITSIKGEKGKFAGPTSPEVYVDFDTQEEFNQYLNVISNIENGTFKQDLRNIAKAYKYGEVDGYGPYQYLNQIFNVKGNMLKEAKKSTVPNGMIHNPNLKFGKTYKKQPGITKKTKKQTGAIPTPVNPVSTAISQPDVKQSMARLNNFIYYFVENIVTSKGLPNNVAKQLIINRIKSAIGIATPTTAPATNISTNTPVTAKTVVKGLGLGENIRNIVRGIINNNF